MAGRGRGFGRGRGLDNPGIGFGRGRPPPPPSRFQRPSPTTSLSSSGTFPSTEKSSPEVSKVAESTSSLSIGTKSTKLPSSTPLPTESPSLARPPGPTSYRGQSGKPINVTSNYLKLGVDKEMGLFEYEVRFEPNLDKRNDRFYTVSQLTDIIGKTRTFDGTKLFLPKKLDPASPTGVVTMSDGTAVTVSFNFKKERRFGDPSTVQQLNILFKRIFKVLKFTPHNRNFYDPLNAHAIRQHNLSIWPGYVTVVDVYEGGLYLQCDVSHRVLRTETARDVLVKLKTRGVRDIKSEADKSLLGTSVLTRYNNKSYKVDGIDWDMNPESTFCDSKGNNVSYVDYYKSQYNIDVQDRKQPLIVSRLKKRSVSGDQVEMDVCLIPELCLLTGLTDAMRSDFRVMKDVATITRISPETRMKAIKSFVASVLNNPEANNLLLEWGLRLEPETLPLTARQLEPETLFFGRNVKERVSPKADWNRAATSSVLTPVDLKKWAIIFFDRNKAAVQAFCKTLQMAASKMGLQFANPKVVALPDDRTDTYVKQLRNVIDETVQLVLLVVPQQKSDRYSAIKKMCCLEKPIASQVVCLKTISNEKRLLSVAQKVALQINCKLGGELWGVQTPFKRLMVVGIDVFHDKSLKSGSIAGIVTSINDSLSRYFSNVAIQKQGQEIVDALKVSFMQALKRYYEANSCWPDNIVVFRDGVSDSQMDTVAEYEGRQFLDSIFNVDRSASSLDTTATTASSGSGSRARSDVFPAEYSPNFAYVIVQKRITTRIVVPRGPAAFDNPPPGTILDNSVTRRNFKDFFLVPQAVSQGTVTPTHMVVVQERGDLKADIVQKLAYKLTHMYFNWPGTVRVPSPCQYAHKLVDLVGEHLHSEPSPALNDKLYFL